VACLSCHAIKFGHAINFSGVAITPMPLIVA
jgi:hypothetical protein